MDSDFPFSDPPPFPGAERVVQRERVAERWGAQLMRSGFTPVPVAVLANYHRLIPALTPSEILLLIHLSSFRWKKDALPYPSTAILAKRLGLTEQAVRKCARSLESKECLKRYSQRGKPTQYDIRPFISKLEALPFEAQSTT